MKRRAAKKPASGRSHSAKHYGAVPSHLYLRYTFIGLGVIALVLSVKTLTQNWQNTAVLGTTNNLLAKGSDSESSGEDDDNDDNSGSSSNSGSSGSGSNSSSSSNSNSGESDSSGRGSSNSQASAVKVETETESEKREGEASEKLDVKTLKNKTKVDIRENGVRIKLEMTDNKFKISVKQLDGEEVELEGDEALEKINEDLEDDDVKIASSGGRLVIKHGEVEAETHFPLSIDLSTNALIVTTPAGTKTVAILPDVAVRHLLASGIADRIETINPIASPTGSATTSATIATPNVKKIELKELNNQLVFEIKAIDDQKLLGLLPISISKTAFVSAETQQIVKVEQDLFGRILDALSI